jgi:MSHA biogenesis protein MshO
MMNRSKSKGFTLLELIMVIVITGILATMSTSIITYPVKSYLDLNRRTTLVDTAEITLRHMQRDIRRALPNSIRITGSGTVIEMLHTIEGSRYRSLVDGTKAAGSGLCNGNPAMDILDFTALDICFEVLGGFKSFNPQVTSGESLVVYNLGSGSVTADAYVGSNRSIVTNSGNASIVKFTALKFPYSSPQQRFFIVDTPITYRCDTATGKLWRYANYTIAATQPNPPGVNGQLQANKISSCTFSYSSGGASRSGLVNIEIVLADSTGESIRLMHQIHVDNAP